jgi:hypothetical protein
MAEPSNSVPRTQFPAFLRRSVRNLHSALRIHRRFPMFSSLAGSGKRRFRVIFLQNCLRPRDFSLQRPVWLDGVRHQNLAPVESRSGSKASVDIIRLGRGTRLSPLRRWCLMPGILSPSLGWFALYGPLLCDLNVLRRGNCSTLCRGRGKRGIRRADRRQAAEGKNNQTHRSHVVLHLRRRSVTSRPRKSSVSTARSEWEWPESC